jgi:trimethylamine:corrinoid methyltransferase-like protein
MLNISAHVLNDHQLKQIHDAALKVMATVGAKVDHPRTLKALESIGCGIDGNIVLFPYKVVDDLIAQMKDKGRQKAESLASDRPRIIPHATGQATACLDIITDTYRPATRQDLTDATRVVNALDNVILGHPCFIPQDVPLQTSDLHTLAIVARYMKDSSCVEIFDIAMLDSFVEMSIVIKGSMQAVKAAPPFSYRVYGSSPFAFGHEKLELAWQMMDRGLEKQVYVGHVMPVLGMSTPVTLSGYLISLAAEGLAAALLHHAITGRVRFFLGGPCAMDMRTLVSTQSSPECILLHLASMELSRYYGDPEPFLPYAMSTDSAFSDSQTGYEKGLKCLLAVAAGSREIVTGLGVLAQASGLSIPQIVIDNEFCRILDRILEGISFNHGKIDNEIEIICEKGIGGTFIDHSHTTEHYRHELLVDSHFARNSLSGNYDQNASTMSNAKKYVQNILNAPPVEYLDSDQQNEIDRIIASTEQNYRA